MYRLIVALSIDWTVGKSEGFLHFKRFMQKGDYRRDIDVHVKRID